MSGSHVVFSPWCIGLGNVPNGWKVQDWFQQSKEMSLLQPWEDFVQKNQGGTKVTWSHLDNEKYGFISYR